ncbi:unnamed protein product [Prorocentrum cordatum]|uniref:HNH nuclease domain-containing protein n=1 Tax=Prorocentrum cordatum TaxID=2364126 RepID=A0ABN9WV02_9DINO|nr:unnamed protein product [Polarella glacialis]
MISDSFGAGAALYAPALCESTPWLWYCLHECLLVLPPAFLYIVDEDGCGQLPRSHSKQEWNHHLGLFERFRILHYQDRWEQNYVHRLVAHAFLGPPPSTQHCDVNHKDRDRGNNHIDNLDSSHVPRTSSIHTNSTRRTCGDALSKPVLSRWAAQGGRWTNHSSGRLASLETGVDLGTICKCCKGKMISAKGYEFKYGAPIVSPCLPGEEWRPALHPCTGTELSTWEVSSHGRMKSSRGLVSYGSQTLAGYRLTGIRTHGRLTNHLVHRLVARAFFMATILFRRSRGQSHRRQ